MQVSMHRNSHSYGRYDKEANALTEVRVSILVVMNACLISELLQSKGNITSVYKTRNTEHDE